MSSQSVYDIYHEIEDIDRGIRAIRKNRYLSAMEKIAIIDEQLDIRNSKITELQQQRAREFKEFLDSLELDKTGVDAVLFEPTKCNIILRNEESHKLATSKKVGPWDRMTTKLFHKQNDKFEEIKLKQSERDSLRKKNLKAKVAELKKKPKLSDTEQISLFLMSKELEIIRKYQKGEQSSK
ncbi:hypothetical protein TVAG_153780 [Trichomonas vaginalis G3]|uniref:Uncharacterized protein n=1 Tax=Trichomonas vaginalis (strain ATCC PRA-98 / G3) TaxID=412133 RepID=A2EPT3_TRIV3|nr:hypothetical protein TVAGG3_0352380 [Trichomonas vaginalis G3]EAY05344.1 hypothetical protein TVAG_153780 [Trichomonas vaginalis G3]KAI5531379.1 hypothetical protein TVAGG3_0352380 [Trichomonas vaginalis G3]|eukprot:XP_001317567.1 hypothetical protein [Trichomonas vaginalis G3]